MTSHALIRPIRVAVTISTTLLLALGSTVAMAGTRTGTLSNVGTGTTPLGAEVIYLTFTGASTESGPPACQVTGIFIFDLSTEKGREAANLARLAFALGRSLSVAGTNQCLLQSGFEDGSTATIL